MNILIAEDEPVANRMLEVKLKHWGYETISTGNGADAVAAVEGPIIPEIVLLDVSMPGIDGYEACRRMRKIVASKGISDIEIPYIILLTANDSK